MTAKTSLLEIDGLQIDLVQKRIKNVTIGVYPPEGRIRVSAPLSLSRDRIVKSILPRLDWMKLQREKILKRSEASKVETPNGPVRYLFGTRYPFEVVEHESSHSALVVVSGLLKFYVKRGSNPTKIALALKKAYHDALTSELELLMLRWSLILGVRVNSWSIKQMKTKWGSCNITDRKIVFNLELAKHSHACIEYVVAHELIHLHEPSHNERFKKFMTEAIPNWKHLKAELQNIAVES
jgi:predicted metal-dependent hydrolase